MQWWVWVDMDFVQFTLHPCCLEPLSWTSPQVSSNLCAVVQSLPLSGSPKILPELLFWKIGLSLIIFLYRHFCVNPFFFCFIYRWCFGLRVRLKPVDEDLFYGSLSLSALLWTGRVGLTWMLWLASFGPSHRCPWLSRVNWLGQRNWVFSHTIWDALSNPCIIFSEMNTCSDRRMWITCW
jgi:hypothetical protein